MAGAGSGSTSVVSVAGAGSTSGVSVAGAGSGSTSGVSAAAGVESVSGGVVTSETSGVSSSSAPDPLGGSINGVLSKVSATASGLWPPVTQPPKLATLIPPKLNSPSLSDVARPFLYPQYLEEPVSTCKIVLPKPKPVNPTLTAASTNLILSSLFIPLVEMSIAFPYQC